MKLIVAALAICAIVLSIADGAMARDRPVVVAVWSPVLPKKITGPASSVTLYYDYLKFANARFSSSVSSSEVDLAKFVTKLPSAASTKRGTELPFAKLDQLVQLQFTQATAQLRESQADLVFIQSCSARLSSVVDSLDVVLRATTVNANPLPANPGSRALSASASNPGDSCPVDQPIIPKPTATWVETALPGVVASAHTQADAIAKYMQFVWVADAADPLRGHYERPSGGPCAFPDTDDCITKLVDATQATLNDIIPRSVLKGTITKEQGAYLTGRLKAVDLSPIAPGGAQYKLYSDAWGPFKARILTLANAEPSDFRLDASAGAECGRSLTRTDTYSIKFTAIDRFKAGDDAKSQFNATPIVDIACYAPLVVSAGVGYSTIPVNTFQVVQTAFLTNSGGPPPAPAPSFQPVFQLQQKATSGRTIVTSMANLCFCAHPADGTEMFFSFGYSASQKSTFELIAGPSIGIGRKIFFTAGLNYGQQTILAGGNAPNDFVPKDYTIPTTSAYRTRPAFTLTIGI
jgi:hypothetical protein